MLGEIDWQALLSPNGYFYHGYDKNGVRLDSRWDGFGVETFGVFLAALAGDGILTTNTFKPPSDNGSGFIYHASYPVVPEGTDRWGNVWTDLRQSECDTQIHWYATLPHVNTNLYDLGLFGLSAAEGLSGTEYFAYGTGGKTSPYNDGDHQVVTPHYSGLIAPLRLTDSTRMWESLESLGLLSPLNNVESLAINPTNGATTVNFLRGSWNLALQAEGWALAHTQVNVSVRSAFRAIPSLYSAYQTLMTPPTAGYPDSTNAVTVPEGGTATFQVKLNRAPVSPTTVTVSRVSGDTDITVQSGGSLVFNASNWNTYQKVTLRAAKDVDTVNSSAVIRCSAPGLADRDVTATEQDNDLVVNLALALRGSTITGNNGANWINLIDGVTNGYTGSAGYGYTYWAANSRQYDAGPEGQVHDLAHQAATVGRGWSILPV